MLNSPGIEMNRPNHSPDNRVQVILDELAQNALNGSVICMATPDLVS